MLQFVPQGAASAVSAPASDVLPANSRTDQPDSAQDALAVGELFASELGNVAEQQAALLAALEPAADVAVEPPALADGSSPAAPALDAEQWLLSMLGQRDVQLQAHDALPSAPAVPAPMPAAVNVPREALPLRAGLPASARLGYSADAPVAVNDKALDLPSNPTAGTDSARLAAALPKAEAPLATQVKPADAPLLAALESLTAAGSTPAEAADAVATASSSALPSAPSAALERSVRLQGPQAKWGEQMLTALRDNVELQVQQRVQSTTIRLDPPELGSMEIFLSHESGRLSVHITASQADVARLLQNTSERLRQELVGQHFTQVSVGVGSDGQSGQQHSQRDRARFLGEAEVAANHFSDAPVEEKTGFNRDVLITV